MNEWTFKWSLTLQRETVIIEVFTMQVLKLRVHPQQLHRVKHLPLINCTYGDQDFKRLLIWVMTQNVDTSVTRQISSWLVAQETWIMAKVGNITNKLGLLATTFW